MKLYDENGEAVYISPLYPLPGHLAALYTDEMRQASEWRTIRRDWRADWADLLPNAYVTYVVLWDGGERMRRIYTDTPMMLGPNTEGMRVEINFWKERKC